jgi:hypothetical protein
MQAGATFNTKRVSNTPEILAELQVIFPDKSIEQIMALFSRPDGKLQANQPRRRTFARPIPLSKNASEVIPAPRAAAPKPVKIPMPEEPPTIITKIVELGDAWTDDSTPKVSEGRRGRAPSRERLQAGLDNYLSEAFRRSRGYTRKP